MDTGPPVGVGGSPPTPSLPCAPAEVPGQGISSKACTRPRRLLSSEVGLSRACAGFVPLDAVPESGAPRRGVARRANRHSPPPALRPPLEAFRFATSTAPWSSPPLRGSVAFSVSCGHPGPSPARHSRLPGEPLLHSTHLYSAEQRRYPGLTLSARLLRMASPRRGRTVPGAAFFITSRCGVARACRRMCRRTAPDAALRPRVVPACFASRRLGLLCGPGRKRLGNKPACGPGRGLWREEGPRSHPGYSRRVACSSPPVFYGFAPAAVRSRRYVEPDGTKNPRLKARGEVSCVSYVGIRPYPDVCIDAPSLWYKPNGR